MAKKTTQTTTSSSTSSTREQSKSQSTTKNILDEQLLNTILGGLTGQMTQEEIAAFAENLLRPQLNAGLEASRQQHEATELAKQQEIENLAVELAKGIEQQNRAYRQSVANVETAALARGMGRSSYTLQNMANQGNALAQAVMQLTDENARRSQQIQAQISQSAQQAAQTQGRLNTDYAAQLAAQIQQMTQQQRQEANSNYLTAISAAMGQQTTGTSESIGTNSTNGTSVTTTLSGSGGSGGSTGSSENTDSDAYTMHKGSAGKPGVDRYMVN
jgi:hypothetical protein